jgi:Histidine kinase
MNEPGELNRFQRWYFDWAAPHYARMGPELREQMRAIDCFLYSRRGIVAWLGLAGGMAGGTVGLHAAGLPWHWALVLGTAAVFFLVSSGVSAWLMPERFSARRLWRIGWIMMLASYAGVFTSLVARGKLAWGSSERWLETMTAVAWEATPFQMLVGLLLLVLWVTATARREYMERALARSRLEQERDQAARQASEARLQLLQAQIEPHFLFNTLAALQHWVDTGDARA